MLRIFALLIRGIFCIPYWVMTMANWNKKGKGTEKERYDYLLPCVRWVVKRARVNMIVSGVEKLPQEGGYMIAPNHQGMFDAFMLLSTHERPLTAVFKIELTTTPIVKDIAEFLKAYAMDRSNLRESIKVIRQVGEDIKKGRIVVIFPEGTRSRTGELGKAAPGALMMASKALAPIVPACVVGTDVFRVGKIWPKVSVRFGKPIYFPKDEPITKEVLKNMTDEMMARIAELQAGVKNGN